MPSMLTVICVEKPHSEDLNLVRLAEFLGLCCNLIILHKDESPVTIVAEYLEESDNCIALGSRTLAEAFQKSGSAHKFKSLLLERSSSIFIYGFLPGHAANYVLPIMSGNIIKSVLEFDSDKHKYLVSRDFEEITAELSGTAFGPINRANDFGFVTGNKAVEKINLDSLISISNKGLLIRLRKNDCTIFLLAARNIINIEAYLKETDNLRNHFSEFAAPMIFLKHIFKESCWHNDTLNANLIIDDPLLKKKYGFLKYDKLLNIMYKLKFATTIAFIPWNYKRTDKSIAELFAKEKDKLGLCVHGCNHTKAEFAASDRHKLQAMIQLATARMDDHKNRNNLDYAKVMVFPQGHFSIAAIKQLKENNYLAAVNSTVYATDSKKTKIADLLDIATTCYDNFPVFSRRYPYDNVADFAIDAFLGKPLLIVEHHGFFKDGYSQIGKYIKQISSILKKVKWRSLNDVLQTTFMKRFGNSGEVFCKIYTNKVILKNIYNIRKKFIIQKNETSHKLIKCVLLNGSNIHYDFQDGIMELSIELKPFETITLEIIYKNSNFQVESGIPLIEEFKISTRRYMSEFRDNYLSRNDFLLNFAVRIKSKFL